MEERDFAAAEHRASEAEIRKRASSMWWAVAMIWAGLVFGAESLGMLPQIGGADAWSWVFLGAGALGLLSNLYYIASESVRPTTWDWIWAGGLTILGLFGFTSSDLAWPLILILAGGAILARNYLRR